jgi:hypothetical protein
VANRLSILLKEIFVDHWGLKIVSLIITFLLLFLAYSQ